jgi:hypothetical protein
MINEIKYIVPIQELLSPKMVISQEFYSDFFMQLLDSEKRKVYYEYQINLPPIGYIHEDIYFNKKSDSITFKFISVNAIGDSIIDYFQDIIKKYGEGFVRYCWGIAGLTKEMQKISDNLIQINEFDLLYFSFVQFPKVLPLKG